jgi:hypothetical protein
MIIYCMNLNLCNIWKPLKIVIDFVKEDKKWKCFYKTKHDWIRSNGLYVFLNSFGDPYPLCKYDLLEENNPFYLLHIFFMNECHLYIYILSITKITWCL